MESYFSFSFAINDLQFSFAIMNFSPVVKIYSFYAILQENGINAELGLAASEDAILDTLSERAEKEIVSGDLNEKNLIGHCAPFLSKLCRNYNLMQNVITSNPTHTTQIHTSNDENNWEVVVRTLKAFHFQKP